MECLAESLTWAGSRLKRFRSSFVAALLAVACAAAGLLAMPGAALADGEGLIPPSTLQTLMQPKGCDFELGFKVLYDALPKVVGACSDNQTFTADGSAQHTANGLMT